jgi:hypothetical protein
MPITAADIHDNVIMTRFSILSNQGNPVIKQALRVAVLLGIGMRAVVKKIPYVCSAMHLRCD